jgi:hypothetical protein
MIKYVRATNTNQLYWATCEINQSATSAPTISHYADYLGSTTPFFNFTYSAVGTYLMNLNYVSAVWSYFSVIIGGGNNNGWIEFGQTWNTNSVGIWTYSDFRTTPANWVLQHTQLFISSPLAWQ